MPSPISTSGFEVRAQPGINYPDPRLMAPAYGDIIPSVRQGLGLFGDIQQIQDAPMARRLKLAQIQEAEQNAAFPRELVTGSRYIGGAEMQSPYDIVATEEGQEPNVPKKIYKDRSIEETGIRYGPGGPEPFTRIKVEKPADTLRQEDMRIEDLAAHRERQDAVAAVKNEIAATNASNKKFRIVSGTVDGEGNLIINRVDMTDPTGRVIETPTGRKPRMGELEALAAALTAPANIAAAPTVSFQAPAEIIAEAVPEDVKRFSRLFDRASSPYKTPEEVAAAVGKTLTREEAIKILRDQFGMGQ